MNLREFDRWLIRRVGAKNIGRINLTLLFGFVAFFLWLTA